MQQGTPRFVRARRAPRIERARIPIEEKRRAHEARLRELSTEWDVLADRGAPDAERRAVLEALRERTLERNYINNLLAGIERELSVAALSRRFPADSRSARAPSLQFLCRTINMNANGTSASVMYLIKPAATRSGIVHRRWSLSIK